MPGGAQCSGLGRPDHPPGKLLARRFQRRGRPGTSARSELVRRDRAAVAGDREVGSSDQGRAGKSGNASGRGVAKKSAALDHHPVGLGSTALVALVPAKEWTQLFATALDSRLRGNERLLASVCLDQPLAARYFTIAFSYG